MNTLNKQVGIIVDGLSMPVPERRWFEEWREAGIGCVNTTVAVWENAAETLGLLGKWRVVLEQNQDLVAPAASVAEIEAVAASGRTAVMFGFQNTAPVEHNLDLFGMFRELGVCVMQLTYNLQNYIGCGYWEEKDTGISSRFGKLALEEMNQLGILIDLSHCGERTTLEAIQMSGKPVAITHANPREYVGTPVYGAGRLKQTEALRELARRGGVIGLTPNRNMTRHGAATTIHVFTALAVESCVRKWRSRVFTQPRPGPATAAYCTQQLAAAPHENAESKLSISRTSARRRSAPCRVACAS